MNEPDNRLPALMDALRDPHVSVGWNAARELAKMGSAARPALFELAKSLRHRDATTALWARFAIAIITGETAKHLPVFIEALNGKQVYPGMAAAALAGLGAAALPAIPELIPKLRDESADNRWGAAWAIANIAKAVNEEENEASNEADVESADILREAVLPLAGILRGDADEKVRWYAAFALSEIGPDAADALPALTAALDDFDDDVRGYAARALGRIGPLAITALPRLTALRDDPTENENAQREAEAAVIAIWS